MSLDPLVSIIIPVYNGANYLGEAIESALAQTYPAKELLVIDDGSSDGGATRAVAESFGDRIRYFRKPNGGVATALNSGVEQMRGELFSWLSHDDLYRPEKVARQVEAWERFGQPCVVIGDFELIDVDGNSAGRVSLCGHNLVARPLDAVFRGLINGCALMVPRSLFDQVGLFEPGLPTSQDYDLWYRIARLVPFVHCPYADVRQRVHALQGSRHRSHLDEASRMFAHLIDLTPPRLMRAYDGSELRFLLRTRSALPAYPGLQAYLTRRIDPLLEKLRYSAALWTDGAAAVAPAQLAGLSPPPTTVVAIDSGGDDNGPLAVNCTHAAAVLQAAHDTLEDGLVLFVRAARPPSGVQVRAALEAIITGDLDAAKPAGVPPTLSEIDGLIARRDALPALSEALRPRGCGIEKLRPRLRLGEYPAIDPVTLVETPEEVTEAIQGGSRVDYHRGLSEAAVAQLIAALHSGDLPTILFIQHSRGGGGLVHLKLLVRALAGKANAVIAFGASDGTVRLTTNPDTSDAGLVFHVPRDLPCLARILRCAGVGRVDVHHTISFEKQAEMLLDELDLPFDITLVDYHFIADPPFLCFDDGRFAGDAALRPGGGILRRRPLPILRKAARIIAISRDLAERFERLCNNVPIIPARLWHDEGVRIRHVFPPRLWGNEPLRVVVAGAIGQHKGRDVIIEVGREIAARHLPVRLHVMGRIQIDHSTLEEIGDALTIHGPYAEGGFGSMLSGIAPHVGWVPAQVPETWSYVLSDLMDAALPIVASALGAIPERCYGRPFTWLLPWDSRPNEWLDLFLRLHADDMRQPARWVDVDHLPPAEGFYFSEYLRPVSPAATV